jgi:hypothetical protein
MNAEAEAPLVASSRLWQIVGFEGQQPPDFQGPDDPDDPDDPDPFTDMDLTDLDDLAGLWR